MEFLNLCCACFVECLVVVFVVSAVDVGECSCAECALQSMLRACDGFEQCCDLFRACSDLRGDKGPFCLSYYVRDLNTSRERFYLQVMRCNIIMLAVHVEVQVVSPPC